MTIFGPWPPSAPRKHPFCPEASFSRCFFKTNAFLIRFSRCFCQARLQKVREKRLLIDACKRNASVLKRSRSKEGQHFVESRLGSTLPGLGSRLVGLGFRLAGLGSRLGQICRTGLQTWRASNRGNGKLQIEEQDWAPDLGVFKSRNRGLQIEKMGCRVFVRPPGLQTCEIGFHSWA